MTLALRLKAFLAASGAALAVLAGVHLLSVAHFFASAASPFDLAAARLSNPFWRLWDWTTLVLALAHGGGAFALVLEARVADPRRRAGATALLALALVVATALATYAYFTLQLGTRNPAFGGP